MTNYKSSPTGQLLLSLFATTKTVAAVTFSAFKMQIVKKSAWQFESLD